MTKFRLFLLSALCSGLSLVSLTDAFATQNNQSTNPGFAKFATQQNNQNDKPIGGGNVNKFATQFGQQNNMNQTNQKPIGGGNVSKFAAQQNVINNILSVELFWKKKKLKIK